MFVLIQYFKITVLMILSLFTVRLLEFKDQVITVFTPKFKFTLPLK